MRRWLLGFSVFLFLFTVSAGWARQAEAEVVFRIGQKYYEAEGQKYPMDVAPFLERDRTYVPLRYLAYALGVPEKNVGWNAANRTVTLNLNGPVLKLVIGTPAIWIDNGRREIDVAPLIRQDRTMLPARFVAEALGYVVNWEANTQTIRIVLPPAAKVLASALNLREGPGTSYGIKGRVERGEVLRILKAASGWYQVQLENGQEGWVAAPYTEPLPTLPSPISRGTGEKESNNPKPLDFTPYRFKQPVRVLLSPGETEVKVNPSGNYALLDGAGKVLVLLSSNDVLTFTALSLPVGSNTAAIQVEKNRETVGLYPGPLVLAAGQEENWFSLTGGSFSGKAFRGNLRVDLNNGALRLVNELEMEDYLKGVVPGEMPASWPLEALKAQAVAARSYALSRVRAELYPQAPYQLLSDTRDQVYGGMSFEQPNSNRAVEETRGEVLLYGGEPIAAYFCSSNGGYTERSEDVWRYPCGYLEAKPDPYDHHPSNPHYGWQRTLTVDEIVSCLASRNFNLSVVEDVYVVERTATGRVKVLEIWGRDQNNQPVRQKLGNADYVRVVFGLKAPASDLSKVYDPATGRLLQITFTGNGWGHCLGMSQWGARGMAEKGFSYRDILAFYYPGAKLLKLW
ncbi:SpoIID/LytB domain protein [Ammonifex degensii KC4]|uniref:SpoIID/LytB domain protein n=1 Tax=Ammonifex degensii (strain DSM 10501 / KC4) TaxID=429009 RepID=C9R8U2_AMMDK|nr:SpoIID/LytB domain-containing protein [Ammonifex degensii]ACX52721.1 SpoIID/LytB domain protein [Ammonifex degensii KC4]